MCRFETNDSKTTCSRETCSVFCYVKKYVGSDKPEAPIYWDGTILGGQEIMSVGDQKKHFLAHQSERIGRQWMKKNTAKVLFDAESANATRKGIDASSSDPQRSF